MILLNTSGLLVLSRSIREPKERRFGCIKIKTPECPKEKLPSHMMMLMPHNLLSIGLMAKTSKEIPSKCNWPRRRTTGVVAEAAEEVVEEVLEVEDLEEVQEAVVAVAAEVLVDLEAVVTETMAPAVVVAAAEVAVTEKAEMAIGNVPIRIVITPISLGATSAIAATNPNPIVQEAAAVVAAAEIDAAEVEETETAAV